MTLRSTGDRDVWQVPGVAALRGLEPQRPAWQSALLRPRRLLATVLLSPLMLWAARSSVPATLDPSPGWWVALAAVALLAAATLATYVPLPRGEEQRESSSCARAAWVLLVLAGLALGAATASFVSVLPAVLLTVVSLRQRLAGVAACGPSPR